MYEITYSLSELYKHCPDMMTLSGLGYSVQNLKSLS